ncbi:putative lipoprotein [Sediminispirochaeta smaragdinae DSM 11293]|uniref:Lipoprotein n=2 Tax=Sediminispirochaeta TaxID=1911556 RepID=E1R6J3_SEDSS|nr:putative lipoprotein [Sediminispirochaeta smaragdinae DSM 11293]
MKTMIRMERPFHTLWLLAILTLVLLIVASCAGNKAVTEVQELPKASVVQEQPPVQEPPKAPAEATPTHGQAESEFVLSETAYKETKRDLSDLVQELNKIIAAKDYEKWLTYLTKEYRAYYSDPAVLRAQSEAPLLKKYSVVLRSLKDYFHYVVVGSRQNVRLDEIKALDENRVRAYMYVDNTPVIIYELQKVDNQWKIGIIE